MGKILDQISSPDDLKSLSAEELNIVCEEIRSLIIDTVSHNGGHLASNLGIVELTVALVREFNLPIDKIVWDVGHQSYPYKILTDRYKSFTSIRTEGGLSGFPSREESKYDSFTTGHSSASISSALGLLEANRIGNKDGYVVAVIGDGALTGGLAYEGLNNAGRIHRNLIVILNDNNMSISKNVGSMARHLTYVRTRPGYIKAKKGLESSLRKLPVLGKGIAGVLRGAKRTAREFFYSSTIFEDLGFKYYGPFDGHNIKDLSEVLKSAKLINKPVFIHIKTDKGKGYRYAEESPSVFHGPSGFNIRTGETGTAAKVFSDAFGKTLCDLAENNIKLCAVTAAMKDGTGLTEFKSKYRERFFDVGIAEEHAVTFSGGLSVGGMLPVFAVYSTFLQRAYDELIHDVSLQNTKVILAIDRAGIVGEDGKTHQGLFDAAYLRTIPNTTVYSPSFFDELDMDLRYLVKEGKGICAVRYPRGTELYRPEYFIPSAEPYNIYSSSKKLAVVTYGREFSFAAKAAEDLKLSGLDVTLVKLNRIIPMDTTVFDHIKDCSHVFFFEEGIKNGGIGEGFSCGLYQSGFKGEFILTAVEDAFVTHAPMYNALKNLGLTDDSIKEKIDRTLQGGE